jgi:hypothetical protein
MKRYSIIKLHVEIAPQFKKYLIKGVDLLLTAEWGNGYDRLLDGGAMPTLQVIVLLHYVRHLPSTLRYPLSPQH